MSLLKSLEAFPALTAETAKPAEPTLPWSEVVKQPGAQGEASDEDSYEAPRTLTGRIEEEIQRVRQQIEDMAVKLKEAFQNEKYQDVKTIGERKKELEEKLKKFEEQYSNDKVRYELQSVKSEISTLDAEMKAAFENEQYLEVAELGKKKKELQNKLAELESNFGLHNAVYQVGDRVSVVGLTSPRGGAYNGLEGTITEYLSENQTYRILAVVGEKQASFALRGKYLSKDLPSLKPKPIKLDADDDAAAGASQTRQLVGEIKLWFPRKHFGFIMPDNKPEDDPDIFFHGTHVENRKDMPVKRFARVKFSVIPAPKGPQARDVTITEYQPEKEAEAEAAEAAAAAESGNKKGEQPAKSSKKKRKSKKAKKAKLPSPAGSSSSVISAGTDSDSHPFPQDVNIEDSLDSVAPGVLGFGGKRLPSWKSVATGKRQSSRMRGSSRQPRSKQMLSSIGEKLESHWMYGNANGAPLPFDMRASAKQRNSHSPRHGENRNREEHHNWGSISSNMGSMRWDSVRSVTDFFKNSRGAAGPVKPTEAPNRPKMSIMGSGFKRRNGAQARAPVRNTTEILREILQGRPQVRATRTVDNSSRKAVDLRSSGNERHFLNNSWPLNKPSSPTKENRPRSPALHGSF
jgi:cold shock CspA family protein